MQRILIVKTSSLGDVVHTLPALTDAWHWRQTIQFDWLVESAFAEIPAWHPAVHQVIPVALRQWRQRPWQTWRRGEWRAFKKTLQTTDYDAIIDAQGLIKSALLSCVARGRRYGLDWYSAREPVASRFYHQHYAVAKNQHAVERLRTLFAAVLGYPKPDGLPDYGIANHFVIPHQPKRPLFILLHGTTWATKHWPETYWHTLAHRLTTAGCTVRIPWGNAIEQARALRLASIPNVELIPKGNLQAIAYELIQAQCVIGVDTGLAHLAAALNIPTITLYGATHPGRTGTYGRKQIHLQSDFPCSPCFSKTCTYRQPANVQPACYTALSVDKLWHIVTSRFIEPSP